MQAILDAGLRIPADVALLGCGNIPFDDYLHVPLSSVDQQSTAIGIRAAQMAIDLVHSGKTHAPADNSARPQNYPAGLHAALTAAAGRR
jgi:LacI family transcriptional regulator